LGDFLVFLLEMADYKNAMILFTTLAKLDSSIEKEILIWEMENSKEEDKLFICRIRKTLQKCNLPSPEEIAGCHLKLF
jgi:hypothetical protein